MLPGTQRQKEVLDYIVSFTKRRGYAPTYVQIARHLGIKSRATIAKHIEALEKRGLIVRRNENGTFVLVVKGDKPPRDPYRIAGRTLAFKYELLSYAGGGGMGAVYRATDPDNSQVAVKILKPDIAARNPEYAELFEKEVEAARRLYHPHIVEVLDSGRDDGISFMVMEWIDGKSLEDVIEEEKVSLERAKIIFGQICSAIGAAHERNVIHLDIKPANCFLLSHPLLEAGEDFVKIIDFGLSRIISRESGTTVTRFRGTHQYCAPEQFGGKVSYRSDIYSLGATLYHLIAGVIPFSSSYINAKSHPNLELPEVPSLKHYVQIPVARLDRLFSKVLNRDPNLRHESAMQLFDEFSDAITLP